MRDVYERPVPTAPAVRATVQAIDDVVLREEVSQNRGDFASAAILERLPLTLGFPRISFREQSRYTVCAMSIPTQPNIKLLHTPDYRENYSNSVQVRVSVWDFFLVFGTMEQKSENEVDLRNFQGVYLSPQQAKALASILAQNVASYESTFGEIKLDPRMATGGPIH